MDGCDAFEAYKQDALQHTVLSDEEERYWLRRLPDEEAKDVLFQCNLRFVVGVATRYTRSCCDLMDAIQEGNIGLRHAIDKYDIEAGGRGDMRFALYAVWWIRQRISRMFVEGSRPMRLPHHMGEQVARLQRLEEKYLTANGELPDDAKLAADMGPPTRLGVL